VWLRVRAKIQRGHPARGSSTSSRPAAPGAGTAPASECTASRRQSKQIASQGDREAAGHAPAPAGTISAEQPSISEPAAGTAGADSPAPRSLEPPDSRSAARAARTAARVGADDSRAAEIRSAVVTTALAANAAGTAPGYPAASALAPQHERNRPPGQARRSRVYAGIEWRRS